MSTSGAVEQIRKLAESFDGTLGVAARDLSSGAEFTFNPDDRFPTASTFKTVLTMLRCDLAAMPRQ